MLQGFLSQQRPSALAAPNRRSVPSPLHRFRHSDSGSSTKTGSSSTILHTSPTAAEAQASAIATRLATPESAPPGQLPSGLRSRLGRELGFDFSQVKVHAGSDAAARTAAFGAHAFSEGPDLFFAPGRWSPETHAGAWLAAHEAVHAAQFGFAPPGVVSPQPRYFQKGGPPKADPRDIFEEVKKRAPDLAVFIDVKTINDAILGKTVEGPAVPAGTDGTDVHEWRISLTLSKVSMSSMTGGTPLVKSKKTKAGQLITHTVPVVWGTLAPFGSGPQAKKVAEDAAKTKTLPAHASRSQDYAFELSLVEPLIHELLHARILMEKDPSFAKGGKPHSKLAQGYFDIIAASQTPGVKKERDEVRKQLLVFAGLRTPPPTPDQITKFVDPLDEFLVHEKYDGQTVYGLMGFSGATNAKIADAYVKTIDGRVVHAFGSISVSDPMETKLLLNLTNAVTAYYDAIDKALASATQPPGSSPAPATPSDSAPAPQKK